MPDKFISIETDDENGATKRLKDMGDGTHAEVVSTSAAAGAAASSLARPTVARNIALATAVNAGLQLTGTCTKISMTAVGGNARYRLGTATGQVSAPDHFIREGERLDIAVLAGAVLYATGTTGTLEVTELT